MATHRTGTLHEYTDDEARQALIADKRAMPNGHERPGEHWNARLLREESIRDDIARSYQS